VRLVVLVVLALALIVMDSQWRMLEPARRAMSVALYPFQRAVMAPRDLVQQVNEWVNAANLIRSENEALQRQRIELAQVATHAAQLAAENAQLRRLLGVTEGAGKNMGLDEKWAYNIIKQVGNYGESFERTVGQDSPLKIQRGLNAQWTDGGLMYGLPIR
jgi:soluble lytic murein transglycosylase-like protein